MCYRFLMHTFDNNLSLCWNSLKHLLYEWSGASVRRLVFRGNRVKYGINFWWLKLYYRELLVYTLGIDAFDDFSPAVWYGNPDASSLWCKVCYVPSLETIRVLRVTPYCYALLLFFFLKKMMIGYPPLLNNDVAPVIGLPLCGVRHVN